MIEWLGRNSAILITAIISFITGAITIMFTQLWKIAGDYIISRFRQIDLEVREAQNKVGVSTDKWRCFFELTIRNHYLDNTIETITLNPPDENKTYTPIFHSRGIQMIDLPLKMKPKDTIKLYYEHDIGFRETIDKSEDFLAKFTFIAQDYYKHKYIAHYFVNFQAFKSK